MIIKGPVKSYTYIHTLYMTFISLTLNENNLIGTLLFEVVPYNYKYFVCHLYLIVFTKHVLNIV